MTIEQANRGSRLDKLEAIASRLAIEIDCCEDVRNLPKLVQQYRDTIREIETISEPYDDALEGLYDDVAKVR